MTKTLLACAGVALFLSACDQKVESPEIVQAPDVPVLGAPEEPVSTPPEPVKPEPAAAAPEIAPPRPKPEAGSTVWATARISVMTDDGIFAVNPGTKLRVVKVTDSGFVVTDEKQEFAVTGPQISLDSAAASGAAVADAAARVAAQEWQRNQLAAGKMNSQRAAANQQLGELQNRYDQLAREEAQLKASIERAHAELMESYNAKNQRRHFVRSISDSQAAAWRARLPVVQAEKDKAFWALKKVQQ